MGEEVGDVDQVRGGVDFGDNDAVQVVSMGNGGNIGVLGVGVDTDG